jgi:predicted  nucleic acid-binding Zn-ribbon protein
VADYISDTTDIFSTTNPSDSSFTFCGGNDWIAYKDEKCFKIIKTSATHDEAEIICNQDFRTDSVAPTLVSIKSAAEQEYLTKFVFEISGVEDNVWIGARRLENSNEFVWNDGSFINDFFDNFAVGSPTVDDRRGCVAMQSELSKQSSNMSDLDQRAINGKWKDVSCNTKNLILCQKMQTWSLQHLQKTFLDFKKELKDSLKDVTNQLSDTRNQLDDTKNELTNTKNELSSTKNDLTTTKNELTNTKNELTATKNELTNTKNELTATKNELTNTQNELTATKNELTNTKNELTAIKNELTNTKNELTTTTNNLNTHLGDVKNKLEVLQKNPSKLDNMYFMCLLICSFYSSNWFHLCSTTGSTRTVGSMGISGLDGDHFTVCWTFLSCVGRRFSALLGNTSRECTENC